jgi:hypothetical protein
MKMFTKAFAASAVFAVAMTAAGAANAVVSPFGGAATGTDPLGHSWSADNAGGAPAWGEPGLSKGTLTFNVGGVSSGFGTYANRFSFIFLEGVSGSVVQSATNDYYDTRFEDVTTGQFWIKSYVGNDKVVFTAPVGSRISQGDEFFVNVIFSGPVDTNKFSFAGLWTDAAGGVPEPTTWAMMLAGFGLIGATARRQRRVAQAA